MTQQDNDDITQSFVPLTSGTQISHYKLIKKLGVGGMGEVHIAEDLDLKRKVALKFLSAQISSEEKNRARFLREARAAAALSHPNIVTVFEVAEHLGRPYIAMEYIEGQSLRELIDRKNLTFDDKIKLSVQLCEGLAAAHNVGLVHRDIKSSNVVVDRNLRARILDFGLAKQTGDIDLTRAGTTIGTVSYMSPEQTRGSNVDKRSDIFSLGVVIYELLTGKIPFERNNMTATLYAIVNEQPEKLTRYLKNSSVELQRIIDKALSKKANERYQDVGLLGSDLLSILGQSSGQISRSAISAVEQREVKSLAVLYLKNLGKEEDDFLSYGITEDLIVDLTRIGSFRVAPMRAVLRFKDSNADLSEIAKKLNVDIIMDGSIHRSENNIRISAQLIDIHNDSNLWAERWEEPFENLAKIKQSLAQGISQALEVGRTLLDLAEVSGQPPESPGAYENYLRAKYNFDHKKNTSDVEIALELYGQALQSEPELLPARIGIAEILLYQGATEKALKELESALEIAVEKNQKQEQANLLRLLARYYVRQSNWTEALKHAKKALKLNRKLMDLAGEAETLGVLISVLQPQAKFKESLELFDRVLEISRHLDDQEKIAESLKNMGVAYSRVGEYDRALSLYEESLELARIQENFSLEAANLSNIGNVYYYQGNLNLALQYQEEACAINTRIGDHVMAARQKLNMGLINIQNSDLDKGVELLRESSETFEKVGEKSMLAMNLINISQASIILGNADEAIEIGESALKIAQEIKHPLAESDAHLYMGMAHKFKSEFGDAKKHYLEALKIAEKSAIQRNVAYGHLLLAHLCQKTEEYKSCIEHAKKALSIGKEIGEKSAVLQAMALLAESTIRDGLYNNGLKQLKEICKDAEATGDNQLLIQLNIIQGRSLLEHGKSKSDKSLGREILERTMIRSKERKLAPEIRMIEELLKKFC